MEVRMSKLARASTEIENKTHYESLRNLLQSLKNNGENIFDTNIHITVAETNKKEVRTLLRQNGFKFAENFGRQVDAFVSANILEEFTHLHLQQCSHLFLAN